MFSHWFTEIAPEVKVIHVNSNKNNKLPILHLTYFMKIILSNGMSNIVNSIFYLMNSILRNKKDHGHNSH